MTEVKIARSVYRRARQNELSALAENIYTRMKGQEVYAPLQDLVDALYAPMKAYATALAATLNKGLVATITKNETRQMLVNGLDELGTGLEVLAAGRVKLIAEAGYSVQQESGPKFKGVLPEPVILRAYSTGKKGELRIVLQDAYPRAVRTHFIQYSIDGGITWQIGEFNSGRMFTIKGLPHAAEMWIQVKSIGNGDNKSGWSAVMVVAVL